MTKLYLFTSLDVYIIKIKSKKVKKIQKTIDNTVYKTVLYIYKVKSRNLCVEN